MTHFDIPLHAISATLLLDIDTARIVKDDAHLTSRKYFLAFLKNGYDLLFEDYDLSDCRLIAHSLFHRTGSAIRIKVLRFDW